jgi:polyhydroxybutyrate depolymerase
MIMRRLFLGLIFLCSASVLSAASIDKPRVFVFDGVERRYFIDIPKGVSEGAPLVVALHGMGGHAHKMRYGTGIFDLAREFGFATLLPQGRQMAGGATYWNAGFEFGRDDDLGFLNALIAETVRAYGLDSRRVYVLGISNGAQMAYHLACNRPGEIRAIAVVIGTISATDWPGCTLRQPISLLHVHGREDPWMPYEGGIGWASRQRPLPSVPELVQNWAEQIHATAVPPPVHDIPNAEIQRYRAETGARVELITLNGFGHDWPTPDTAGFSTARRAIKFFLDLPVPQD